MNATCESIAEAIGVEWMPVPGASSFALFLPLLFADERGAVMYLQRVDTNTIAFHDGGTILHHLESFGPIANPKRVLKAIAKPLGLEVTSDNRLAVTVDNGQSGDGFGLLLQGYAEAIAWEREHDAPHDTSALIQEVYGLLAMAYPNSEIGPGREIKGVTGKQYATDLTMDETAVFVVGPHFSSVAAYIRKLLDIVTSPENADLARVVMLDDRGDKNVDKDEKLLSTFGPVQRLTRLPTSPTTTIH